jgi:ABC-type sugar transport system permease subunit
MASKLTTSNRAGWGFALPAFALIATFIILPFFLAFYFSLTNQRLISPNPTEFVGLENYRDLLGLAVITLEPERDDAGAVVRDEDGRDRIPACAHDHPVRRLPAISRHARVVPLAIGRECAAWLSPATWCS